MPEPAPGGERERLLRDATALDVAAGVLRRRAKPKGLTGRLILGVVTRLLRTTATDFRRKAGA